MKKINLSLDKCCLGVGIVLFLAGLVFKLPPLAELAVFLGAWLFIGWKVAWQALRNISRGKIFNENFLMTIATIGAFAIGEFPEGAAVMLFYRIGEAFQEMAVNKSLRSITALMDLRPDYANLKRGNEFVRVSPAEVKPGDLIVVKPGEKIPLDGIVTEGCSALDTSALSGESMPRDVETGSEVLSGSVNINGLLTITVTREFSQSTASKIINLVQDTESRKAPVENFISRFARVYTPAVVCSALALAVIPSLIIPDAEFSQWLKRALVFLVVSCPCALVISIPLSFFSGIGSASRRGILVKGSNYLSALNDVETVVFDKTGTLTRGVFELSDIICKNGMSRDELLYYAAAAESNSSHPIAQSIMRAYRNKGSQTAGSRTENPAALINANDITHYEEIAGNGIRCCINNRTVLAGNTRFMESNGISLNEIDITGTMYPSATMVHIALDNVYAGCLAISDQLKPDSRQTVSELKKAGLRRIVMLSGDSRAAAEKIGSELGLSGEDAVYAELLPHQKVEYLERLQQESRAGKKLAFVGDGINDAPALARSDIGIAMGGIGSGAAIEAADVVLMTDEPIKLVNALAIARRTRSIVVQNIIFALGVKAVILVLGAMGIATMWMAVFGDVGVALIAVANAMRALKIGELRMRS